ncbi:hypothetical protein [Cohnella faecalis]|uniref:Uncharacterized protein n=1 Tax=Cohnella faecalis TaxID=2315694 RepID=A0A398CLD8_9BACL|nr:hypothetical protein [Cohnella faecalis]RIE03235.1 hypothetical protein D3H35_12730 [Cohnella faecalis]
MVAAQALKPDCAICIDINIAADTPDLKDSNDIALGAGGCKHVQLPWTRYAQRYDSASPYGEMDT